MHTTVDNQLYGTCLFLCSQLWCIDGQHYNKWENTEMAYPIKQESYVYSRTYMAWLLHI